MTVICYATQRDYQVKIEMYPANVCYNLVLAAERAGENSPDMRKLQGILLLMPVPHMIKTAGKFMSW